MGSSSYASSHFWTYFTYVSMINVKIRRSLSLRAQAKLNRLMKRFWRYSNIVLPQAAQGRCETCTDTWTIMSGMVERTVYFQWWCGSAKEYILHPHILQWKFLQHTVLKCDNGLHVWQWNEIFCCHSYTLYAFSWSCKFCYLPHLID